MLDICTPLISGGIVRDESIGFSAISSDTITAYFGIEYNADRLFLLTDVKGVYDPVTKEIMKEVHAFEYKKFSDGMRDKLRRIKFATKKTNIYNKWN